MSLDIRDARGVEGHGPGPAYRLEYVLEVCRGSVEEGAGGRLDCVVRFESHRRPDSLFATRCIVVCFKNGADVWLP